MLKQQLSAVGAQSLHAELTSRVLLSGRGNACAQVFHCHLRGKGGGARPREAARDGGGGGVGGWVGDGGMVSGRRLQARTPIARSLIFPVACFNMRGWARSSADRAPCSRWGAGHCSACMLARLSISGLVIACIVAVDVARKLAHFGLLSLRGAVRGQRKASLQRASAGVLTVRRLWRPAMAMATPF